MNIVIDNAIRQKWTEGKKRKKKVREIVIHGTDGGGTYQFVLGGKGITRDGKKMSDVYKEGIGLFHYLIEPSGRIIEIISPDNWVYHSSSGNHDEETIGIEIQKNSNKNNDATEDQYESLFWLCHTLSGRYPLIERIVSHDYNAMKYSGRDPKPCPGKFDWEKFEKIMNSAKFVFIK